MRAPKLILISGFWPGAGTRRFWGSKRPPPTAKTTGKGQSAILGVWAAPGARETLQKGGGEAPHLFWRVSKALGAAQTPKMTDFQSLKHSKI